LAKEDITMIPDKVQIHIESDEELEEDPNKD
jgi:hypothetical protein